MSVNRASPNMNTSNNTFQKKTTTSSSSNLSPHIPHSSPQQNIQMTATWSPAGQYVSVSIYYIKKK